MANTGITLTVNAETAAALQKMQQFFSGVGGGLDKLSGASHFLSELGSQLAAAFTVGALVEFTRESINTGEQLGKLAQKTGLQIELLAALKKEAAGVGVPFDALNMSLGLFADKIGISVRMGGTVGKVFRDINVPLVEANGNMRSTDAVLKDIADRFQKTIPAWEKAYVAQELFGRSGRELIPILNEGAAGIERMRLEGSPFSSDTVAQSTEFNRSMRELKEVTEESFQIVALSLLPALRELVTYLRSLNEELASSKDLIDAIAYSSKLVVIGLETIVPGVKEVVGDLVDGFTTAKAVLVDYGKQLGLTAVMLARLGSGDPLGAYTAFKAMNSGPDKTNLITDMVARFQARAAATNAAGLGAAARLLGLQGTAALNNAGNVLGAGANSSATGPAPMSEEAKKLILEVDKAFADATKGKLALLDAEEAEVKKKIREEILDKTTAEAELLKVDQIYSAKRVELKNKEEAAKDEIELARIQGRRKLIESDPTITDAGKKSARLDALKVENDLLVKNIALEESRLLNPNLSDEAHLAASKQLQDLHQRKAENEQATGSVTRSGTFGGEFGKAVVELQDQFGSVAKQMAETFKTVFNSAINSISNGITGLIMGTKTWGSALKEIGTSVLTSLVQGIVKVGIESVLTGNIMNLVTGKTVAVHVAGEGTKTGATAAGAIARGAIWLGETVYHGILVGIRTAEHIAGEIAATAVTVVQSAIRIATMVAETIKWLIQAAIKAAVAMASIPYVGPILAIAAMAAVFAAGYELINGFEAGGYTGSGGRSQVKGVVHANEYVFSSPAVDRIGVANLDALHEGRGMPAAAGPGSSSGPAIHVHYWDDKAALNKHLRENPEARHAILDLVGKNFHQFQPKR